MTYKEFILIYLSLISGLACTNIFHGISIVIKRWRHISISWVHTLNATVLFITIADYWFNAFYFHYSPAQGNFFLFCLFLTPSTILFFNSLIIFPRTTYKGYDYVKFFQKNLHINILSFGLFILSLLLKVYVSNFVTDIFILPLSLIACLCLYVYLVNTINAYKVAALFILFINFWRWYHQGIV